MVVKESITNGNGKENTLGRQKVTRKLGGGERISFLDIYLAAK